MRGEAGGEDEAAGFSELVAQLALEGREEGSRKAEGTETLSMTYLAGLPAPESPLHPAGERPKGRGRGRGRRRRSGRGFCSGGSGEHREKPAAWVRETRDAPSLGSVMSPRKSR